MSSTSSDRALSTVERDLQPVYKAGLADLQAKAGSFAQLSREQRIELLKSIEQTEFFKAVRTHTIMGFLSNPSTAATAAARAGRWSDLSGRPWNTDRWWAAASYISPRITGASTSRTFTSAACTAESRAPYSPIGPRYADLEPYYTKAEWELGISGLGGANPFEGPQSKPYLLPPMPAKSSGVLFERAAKKLGLHPYPAPVAVISKDYRGRRACVHCGFCEAFGCEMNSKSSTLASLTPEAEKTGKCEVRAESVVRKIVTNNAGRVTGVLYFHKTGREVLQRARPVVVCANGAETPRLLLMSASKRFPNGLANSSGLVGKYLMFDSGTLVNGLFDKPCNEFKSIVVTRVLHDFYAADPTRGFYGGGLDSRFDDQPIMFALDGTPRRCRDGVPHGQRSENVGGQRREPGSRRAEPVSGGRKQSRHLRRQRPTATIQALAYRAADLMTKRVRRGEV